MTTIKRAIFVTLILLLTLAAAVPADAQRRGGRIRRQTGAAGARGGSVVYHPWPAATCPICASKIARTIAGQTGGGAMSTADVGAWMRTYAPGVEVNPALVRSRIPVVRDYDSIARENAGGGGSTYTVEVETRAAPNGATTYIVSDGGEPFYVGRDYKAMVSTVKQRAGSRSVNVRTRNLTKAKSDAVRSTFRAQQRAAGRTEIVPPESGPGVAGARTSYAARGPRLVEGSVTEPVLVRQGRFKGFYTASLRFFSAGRQLTLRVYAKSSEALRSMVSRVAGRLSNNPNRMSMERLVEQARGDLRRTYNLTDRDLLIQIEDELRNTFFVRIPRPAPLNLG